LGFEKEKREFSPHITIGRVRSFKNLNKLKESLQNNIEFKAGILKVVAISLIESKLMPYGGPIYTRLHSARLT
jgi:RNA 2',3'-cyclic 3'-phosphodiesterase